jgi:hypothetical protein
MSAKDDYERRKTEAKATPSVQSPLERFASNEVEATEGFKDLPSTKPDENVNPEQVVEETTINLDDLDESTLLKYPIIAKSLTEQPMAVIKPKDSSLVFHWVFYDRSTIGNLPKISAQNLQRYRFWGFEFATIDDIEGGEEALGNGMINDGGQIINYDTVLMKINKIRLMGHYKKNLLRSLKNVDGSLAQAIKSAEMDVVQSGTYSKAMSSHPQATIEFYSPVGSKK